jgi:hypothetical protein
MIGLVSESLKTLLEKEMTPSGTQVTLLSPVDTSAPQTRVNLFLYRAIRNPHLNNQEFLPKPRTEDRLVHPPLVLNLFYLLTPFASTDGPLGQANAQDLLTEAMRVLHEHAIVPQDVLAAGLSKGQIKVTQHDADLEELSKIWTALEKDLHLSIIYEVSFTQIPARRERPVAKPVEKTNVVVDVLEVAP